MANNEITISIILLIFCCQTGIKCVDTFTRGKYNILLVLTLGWRKFSIVGIFFTTIFCGLTSVNIFIMT